MDGIQKKLEDNNEPNTIVEGICIIGRTPLRWKNIDKKKEDIESLKDLNIRVLTYGELIKNAEKAYQQYIDKDAEINRLAGIINRISEMPDVDDTAS